MLPVPTPQWRLNAPPQTSGLRQERVSLSWSCIGSRCGGLAQSSIKLASLFTGGRSLASLLCHSGAPTNMRTDLRSHRSRFPFLTLRTCSDRPPPTSPLWDGAHWEEASVDPPQTETTVWSPGTFHLEMRHGTRTINVHGVWRRSRERCRRSDPEREGRFKPRTSSLGVRQSHWNGTHERSLPSNKHESTAAWVGTCLLRGAITCLVLLGIHREAHYMHGTFHNSTLRFYLTFMSMDRILHSDEHVVLILWDFLSVLLGK